MINHEILFETWVYKSGAFFQAFYWAYNVVLWKTGHWTWSKGILMILHERCGREEECGRHRNRIITMVVWRCSDVFHKLGYLEPTKQLHILIPWVFTQSPGSIWDPQRTKHFMVVFFLSTIKESELLKRSKRGGLAQDDVECPTNARGWIVWDGMAWNTSYTLHVTASWAVERCAGWPCLQGLNYQSYRAKHGGHYLA